MGDDDSRWLRSPDEVRVNQRALVEKILSRYALDFFLLKELIQNADDAQAEVVTIEFVTGAPANAAESLSDEPIFCSLSVSNRGGNPFTEDGWERIVEIATGNPDENSVGHFGVGFYSVFAASDTPQISSGHRRMQFGWRGQGIAVNRELLTGELGSNGETVVTLDLKAGAEARRWKIPKVQQFLARALCFLKSVARIDLDVDGATVAQLTREQATDAESRALVDAGKDGQTVPSPGKYFCATRMLERWVEITCTADGIKQVWAGNFVSVDLIQEETPKCKQMTSGVAQVIGKRPPKNLGVQLLYDSGFNDTENALYDAISPLVRSGIFVGFDTGLTSGAGFHTSSSSFLPTMERTKLDMTHPQIACWNGELLAVAGMAARLTYDANMHEMRQKSLGPQRAAVGREPVIPMSPWNSSKAVRELQDAEAAAQEADLRELAQRRELNELGMMMMRAHQFEPIDAGQHIGAAFWQPGHSRAEMLIVSHRGIQNISTVRTIPERLNGIEHFLAGPASLAILSVEDAREVSEFVRSAQTKSGHSLLQELTISEAVKALKSQPVFSARRAYKFLKWYCRMRQLQGSRRHGTVAGGPISGSAQDEQADDVICGILMKNKSLKLSALSKILAAENANLKKHVFGKGAGSGRNALNTARHWLKNRSKVASKFAFNWDAADPAITLKNAGKVGVDVPDNVLLQCVKVNVIHGTVERSITTQHSLASFDTFPDKESLQGIAAPDSTLPLCISKYLSSTEMQQQLRLTPLSFESWFESFKHNAETQGLLTSKTAEQFLKACATASGESETVREQCISSLRTMKCIPCQRSNALGTQRFFEMFRPEETFILDYQYDIQFKGWDLPKPKLDKIEDQFLIRIGVRTQPDIQLVLAQAKKERWTLAQLISYVCDHTDEMTEEDWRRAKDAVGHGWIKKGLDALYLPDTLQEGRMSIRALKLPLVECRESEMTPARQQMMIRMGIQRFPHLAVIVKLASEGSQVQTSAFMYLLENFDEVVHATYPDGNLHRVDNVLAPFVGAKIIPTEYGAPDYTTVADCFLEPNPFGRHQLHKSIDKNAAAKLGVRQHPPLQDCISEVLAHKVFRDRSRLGEYVKDLSHMLVYLGRRCDEFETADWERFQTAKWVPTNRRTLAIPSAVYDSSEQNINLYTDDLFDLVDRNCSRSDRALVFLQRCGMKLRPTVSEFVEQLRLHHSSIKVSSGGDDKKYIVLLERFCEEVLKEAAHSEEFNELVQGLKAEEMFPAVCAGQMRRTFLREISYNDDPGLQDKLQNLVAIGPPKLERFYRLLGVCPLSSRVKEMFITGNINGEYTNLTQHFRDTLHRRSKLLLHNLDNLSEGLAASGNMPRRDSLLDDSIDESHLKKLRIVETSSINRQQTLDGKQVAQLPGEQVFAAYKPKEHAIYLTGKCDDFDFARTLFGAICGNKGSRSEISVFSTLLFETEVTLRRQYGNGIDFLMSNKFGPEHVAAVVIQQAASLWRARLHASAATVLQNMARSFLARKSIAVLRASSTVAALKAHRHSYMRGDVEGDYDGINSHIESPSPMDQTALDAQSQASDSYQSNLSQYDDGSSQISSAASTSTAHTQFPSPEQLGSAIYPQICADPRISGDVALASKLTGMIISGNFAVELQVEMMRGAQTLSTKIGEALDMLPVERKVERASIAPNIASHTNCKDPSTIRAGKDKQLWFDLTPKEKQAAMSLGWSPELWESGTCPTECNKLWNLLNFTQRNACQLLGYSIGDWDAEISDATSLRGDNDDDNSSDVGTDEVADDESSQGSHDETAIAQLGRRHRGSDDGSLSDDGSSQYSYNSDTASEISQASTTVSECRARTTQNWVASQNSGVSPSESDDDGDRASEISVPDSHAETVALSSVDGDRYDDTASEAPSFATTMSRGVRAELTSQVSSSRLREATCLSSLSELPAAPSVDENYAQLRQEVLGSEYDGNVRQDSFEYDADSSYSRNAHAAPGGGPSNHYTESGNNADSYEGPSSGGGRGGGGGFSGGSSGGAQDLPISRGASILRRHSQFDVSTDSYLSAPSADVLSAANREVQSLREAIADEKASRDATADCLKEAREQIRFMEEAVREMRGQIDLLNQQLADAKQSKSVLQLQVDSLRQGLEHQVQQTTTVTTQLEQRALAAENKLRHLGDASQAQPQVPAGSELAYGNVNLLGNNLVAPGGTQVTDERIPLLLRSWRQPELAAVRVKVPPAKPVSEILSRLADAMPTFYWAQNACICTVTGNELKTVEQVHAEQEFWVVPRPDKHRVLASLRASAGKDFSHAVSDSRGNTSNHSKKTSVTTNAPQSASRKSLRQGVEAVRIPPPPPQASDNQVGSSLAELVPQRELRDFVRKNSGPWRTFVNADPALKAKGYESTRHSIKVLRRFWTERQQWSGSVQTKLAAPGDSGGGKGSPQQGKGKQLQAKKANAKQTTKADEDALAAAMARFLFETYDDGREGVRTSTAAASVIGRFFKEHSEHKKPAKSVAFLKKYPGTFQLTDIGHGQVSICLTAEWFERSGVV